MRAIKLISFGWRASTSVAFAVLASGCASGLSRDECNTADWRTIGYEDGVQGRSETRIGGHRKACAKHGVGLNLETYRSGWDEGVRRYCQAGNGYNQGRRGKSYSGVCPAQMEADFLQAYRAGRELYDLEAGVQRTARKLRHKRKRLSAIEVDMRDTGIELVTTGVTTERRVILLDELRKLEQERSATKAQIPSLEAELEKQKNRLATISNAQEY
ncbi:MAG: DUF2799 domain-containing protein [Thiogranum sp.]